MIKKKQPACKGIIDQVQFFFPLESEQAWLFMVSVTLISDISELAAKEQGGGLQYGNGFLQVLRDQTEMLQVWVALIFNVVGACN